ncbi:MAG: helix-turn-helix transcriptional regulator [Fibrobacter sp.]|nr:helix-turn-helix transcriptional regulator [Fibrobacter sp.]
MTHNHDIFCKAFQKLVLRTRKESFISQHQLSLESGLTRQFISMMERGMCIPSFESFCLLARGLGISPAEMMEKFHSIYEREYHSMEERLEQLSRREALMAADAVRSMDYIKRLRG